MMNILLVEDEAMNLTLLQYYVVDYFNSQNIEVSVDLAEDGIVAITLLEKKVYDFIVLDVVMPKNIDGFRVLEIIRDLFNDNNPYICMATSMGESKDKNRFQLKGANSYIIKPYNKRMTTLIFDKFREVYIDKRKTNLINDNVELAKDDFNFDDEVSTNEENQHLEKLSAIDFIEENQEILNHILETIDHSNKDIEELIEYLDTTTLNKYRSLLVSVFSEYSSFFKNFLYFDSITSSIYILKESILELDLIHFREDKSIYIVKYIKIILVDLINWKINSFDKQITSDVYYLNKSIIISSCIQLQNFLKNR